MSSRYPSQPTEESREGDAAHQLGFDTIDALSRGLTYQGEGTASNGVPYTQEMRECAEIYANEVITIARNTRVMGGPNFCRETFVYAKRIHPDCFGTVDAYLYSSEHQTLWVWDYKHGHRVVNAYNNLQGIIYVVGIMDALGLHDLDTMVNFTIVQPRAYRSGGPIDQWTFPAYEIRDIVNILTVNAVKALSPDAQCHTGAHCRDCSARHACVAALNAGMQLFEASSAPLPQEASTEALGLQYSLVRRAREQLEYLESGYEAQIMSRLTAGQPVPGYTLEPKPGRMAWKLPAEAITSLGDSLGVDLRKSGILTPNQAVKKGFPESLLPTVTERPTGLSLVQSNLDTIRRVFK